LDASLRWHDDDGLLYVFILTASPPAGAKAAMASMTATD
jgi:hypothetical protein